MGGGARLLSFLKLFSLYMGAIEFVNIRIQPPTVLFILIFIAAQFFFFFVAKIDAVWLAVGPISIVLNFMPYNASCEDYFKFSLYDLFIAIYVVGNNSTHLCLLFPAKNRKYYSSVWFIRSV